MWELRWPSWAVRPNEPSGFRGRKAILNIEPCFGIGHSLSLICQLTSEDIKHHFIIIWYGKVPIKKAGFLAISITCKATYSGLLQSYKRELRIALNSLHLTGITGFCDCSSSWNVHVHVHVHVCVCVCVCSGYYVPNWKLTPYNVRTNKPTNVACRGPGRKWCGDALLNCAAI